MTFAARHVQVQVTQAIAMDIGGTWFRSARVGADGQVMDRRSAPALSARNHPGKTALELQDALVTYLIAEARHHAGQAPGCCTVGISMGAALDHRTGVIWNSGPLWGACNIPFDLGSALRRHSPEFKWHVTNDVSAALLALVAQNEQPGGSDVCYITVSTGIAARIWSARAGGIVVDDIAGMQGEIGHLPVTAEFRGRVLHLTCDCGGAQHLNAVSSGRGMVSVLQHVLDCHPEIARGLGLVLGGDFAAEIKAALERDAPYARDLLSTCLRPLAQVILSILTCNPAIARIHFGGGVLAGLGPELWRDALLVELESFGAYQISDRHPGYFWDLVRVVDGADLGLLGAAQIATCGVPVVLSARAVH
jgi:predicted NBD/HSP70 family sugar kinase